MKYRIFVYILALCFSPVVYAGSFDIQIGKINLPDGYSQIGSPVSVRGMRYYQFADNQSAKLSTTVISIMLYNYKRSSPEMGDLTDKKAAINCLEDTITALNKSYPTKATSAFSESSIGHHFAMEALVLSRRNGGKQYGFIRCMKYKDLIVTVIVYENGGDSNLANLRSKLSDMKLYKS